MNEIISFHRKKQEILRDAVEAADARHDRLEAEMDRLRRGGAPYAELVKASMKLEGAAMARRKSGEALSRFCGAGTGAPDMAMQTADPRRAPAEIICLTR